LTEKKQRIIKTETVDFDTFTHWDFVPPGSFFIRNAMGDYVFLKTSVRKEAQDFIDKEYGKGRYTVVASKLEKGSGNYTCTGTSTRRGQHK
jgi:hypothetical protein